MAAAAATVWPGTLGAQSRRVPVVGVLTNTTTADVRVLIIPETLRVRGYVESQNIRYEFRLAEGRTERLPDLAKELVTLGVDVIVAAGTPAIKAAQQATTTIPIVGIAMADPVRDGLVRNYAAPEANITGNTFLGPELVPKRLGYLKELLPTISQRACALASQRICEANDGRHGSSSRASGCDIKPATSVRRGRSFG